MLEQTQPASQKHFFLNSSIIPNSRLTGYSPYLFWLYYSFFFQIQICRKNFSFYFNLNFYCWFIIVSRIGKIGHKSKFNIDWVFTLFILIMLFFFFKFRFFQTILVSILIRIFKLIYWLTSYFNYQNQYMSHVKLIIFAKFHP